MIAKRIEEENEVIGQINSVIGTLISVRWNNLVKHGEKLY
jgi:hypothetical protein